MTGTCNELEKSHIQRYEFSLNYKAFLARFNNVEQADAYRERHSKHYGLDMKLRIVGL